MPCHCIVSFAPGLLKRFSSALPFVLAVLVWGLEVAVAAAPLEKLSNCTLIPTEWADGDSFLVKSGDGKEFTVRLYGADCLEKQVNDATDERRLRSQRRYFGITTAGASPRDSIELAKNYGRLAAQEVGVILAKPFTVHSSFADARGDGRHKRIYAFVVTSQGTDLAAHLVSKGLARAFGVSRLTFDGRSKDEYRDYLADLELRAAKMGEGIWSNTNWENLPTERQLDRQEEADVKLAMDDEKLTESQAIDPNSASKDDLMKLPGVGETLANRMIENRPYSNPEDLLRVPGIGQATLDRILPHLKLSRP